MRQPKPISLNDTLTRYADVPIGESIVPVTRALAKSPVLVAIQDVPPSDSANLSLRVSTDKEGRLWAYIYSDKNEFASAFPEGGQFAEMQFSDIFKIVSADEQFGGIFVNHSEALMYVIPKAVFAEVAAIAGE